MTRKRTRPRDRITQASCLLITALLIVSAVSAGVGTGMASAEPAGMVTVPDQNITEDIPADASVPLGASQLHDGRVLTDSHAMSLDVILTTPARAADIAGRDTASLTGDMALILRDTEHSAGRRVAIDSGLLQTALGYEPEAIYGTHENGEQWTAEATYVDGYLVFDVPHFSTNTVTFSGEVTINAQNAANGTSFAYQTSNRESFEDVSLSITGVTNTNDISKSKTIGGSGSIPVDPGGNLPLAGPSQNNNPTVTLTGNTDITNREAGTVTSSSSSQSLTTGNAPDTDAQLTVTKKRAQAVAGKSQNYHTSGHSPEFTFTIDNPPETVTKWKVEAVNPHRSQTDVHLHDQNGERIAHDIEEYETQTKSGTWNTGGNPITIAVDGTSPSYWYVNIRVTAYGTKSTNSVTYSTSTSSDQTLNLNGGTTTTNLTVDPSDTQFSLTPDTGRVDYSLTYDEIWKTQDPSVTVGEVTKTHSGILQNSSVKTYEMPIDKQTSSVDVSTASSNSLVNTAVEFTERSKTLDPTVTISNQNLSQTVGYNGQLADGETVELSDKIDPTVIGKDNTLTVGVQQAATGPPAVVNLNYSHSSQTQIETDYDSSAFTETYQVNRTYATDAVGNAKLRIPFASSRIVGVKTVKYRVNNGSWQSVTPANYRLDGTVLDVYLTDATGGITSGDTVTVRAEGRKMRVEHGAVDIVSPTKPGNRLNTQLEITSRSDEFALNVGPTANGRRVHYAYSSDYPTEDYVIVTSDGAQQLHLPNSYAGDRFTITHLETRVQAVAGDVKLRVTDPDKPTFDISPGPGGDGDMVELTYYGTRPGQKYMLHSLTRGIILDSATANSPVTFTDDDSDETWEILLESGGGDTSGGGGLIGVASGAASNAGSAVSGLLPAISVPALGGIGGVGSAGFALILAGAVAVLVYGNVFGRIAGVIAALNPFGGTPAPGGGADTGNGGIDTSGVTSALSGVVTRAGRVGGTAGVRVLRAATQLLTTSTRIIGRESARLARYLAANPSVALGLGGVGVAVAAYQGLVQLTPQATTAILIGSGGLVTYLVLQRTGTFSWLSFGLIFGAFIILGAGAINPDVLASFGASLQDILPLLVIVGAYVVYRILQTRSQDASTPDTIVRFTGGGSGSGSDDNNN